MGYSPAGYDVAYGRGSFGLLICLVLLIAGCGRGSSREYYTPGPDTSTPTSSAPPPILNPSPPTGPTTAMPPTSSLNLLDTSFATDGIYMFPTQIDPSGEDSTIMAVATDPIGRTVFAIRLFGPSQIHLLVQRLNPDGTPDLTFGIDGMVELPGATTGLISSLDIDTQGRIVVSGHAIFAGPDYEVAAWRLYTNGNLDPTFHAPDGYVHFIGGDLDDASSRVFAATLDNQDRLIMVGSKGETGLSDVRLWRVDEDGERDLQFGIDGMARPTNPTPYGERGVDVIASNFGPIFVAGYTFNDAAMWSFTESGAANPTFSGSGFELATLGDPYVSSQGYALTEDSFGRIVMVGTASVTLSGVVTGSRDLFVWRFSQTGSDMTFGTGMGFETYEIVTLLGSHNDEGRAVVEHDGYYWVVGNSHPTNSGPSPSWMAVWCLETDGSLHTPFNGSGAGIFQTTAFQNTGTALQFDPLDNLVIVGSGEPALSITRGQAWRLLPL